MLLCLVGINNSSIIFIGRHLSSTHLCGGYDVLTRVSGAMRADAVVFLLCFCPPTAGLNLFKAKRKTFVYLYKGYREQTGDFSKRTAPAPKPLLVIAANISLDR